MSIIAGVLIIFVAGYTPVMISIGMFWPLSLACIPSAILGGSGKINLIGFIFGILLGSTIYTVMNYSNWGYLIGFLVFFQIMLSLVAIMVFILFRTISPFETSGNALVGDVGDKPPARRS